MVQPCWFLCVQSAFRPVKRVAEAAGLVLALSRWQSRGAWLCASIHAHQSTCRALSRHLQQAVSVTAPFWLSSAFSLPLLSPCDAPRPCTTGSWDIGAERAAPALSKLLLATLAKGGRRPAGAGAAFRAPSVLPGHAPHTVATISCHRNASSHCSGGDVAAASSIRRPTPALQPGAGLAPLGTRAARAGGHRRHSVRGV